MAALAVPGKMQLSAS
ncbi:hypothetical protein EYZ11_011390 [Aspergillus tanneri]|uniref:Uncharacterized protein n=1 Tax=Aspergillus tanneri TaxID=1220188 RepID=A0A4S3J2W6_9EURO|nr:hypothetical protein EYZ11_011390 [Aspergillus tanneri]